MRALLAARRPSVLAELQSALVGFDERVEFVSTGTPQAVWALLRNDDAFDIVLVAVDEADWRGLISVAEARSEFPDVSVVLVSPGATDLALPAAALAAATSSRAGCSPWGGVGDAGYVPTTHATLLSLGLTTRQAEVLALLLEGQSNKLIARHLGLSVDTVKDHVAAVMRTLGVNSRTQAVLVVTERLSRRGLARPRSPEVSTRPARARAG